MYTLFLKYTFIEKEIIYILYLNINLFLIKIIKLKNILYCN